MVTKLKTQMVSKLKNSNWDKTQIVTKLKNSICDKKTLTTKEMFSGPHFAILVNVFFFFFSLGLNKTVPKTTVTFNGKIWL